MSAIFVPLDSEVSSVQCDGAPTSEVPPQTGIFVLYLRRPVVGPEEDWSTDPCSEGLQGKMGVAQMVKDTASKAKIEL